MGKIDGLSRRLDWKVGTENNNNSQTLIKKQWICILTKVVIKELEIDILEKIKIARSKNKKVIRVVEKIKKMNVKILRRDEWQIEKDLVLKKEKVYVLKDKELRVEIIWLHHNISAAEHGNRWKMTELVMKNYW